MSDSSVARRYARALLEEAERSGETSTVDEDVALLEESVSGSADLRSFLRSPIIAGPKKSEIARQLFAERLSPITLRFVLLLIEKQRASDLEEILRAYRAQRDLEEGVVEATARLALPIGERERARLRDAVARMTGKRVRLKIELDPRLIGGIVILVGDTVYDGSVLHQLESLHERLQPGQVSVGGDGQLASGPH